MNKLINDLKIDDVTISQIKSEDIFNFLHLSKDDIKPGSLVKKIIKYSNKKDFCIHFKELIVIPRPLVMHYLNCDKELLDANKEIMGFAFSRPIRGGHKNYYYLDKILKAKEIIDDLKEQYIQNKINNIKNNRKLGIKKAIETKNFRKANMPSFITDNNCVFERPVSLKDIKKSMIIAKMCNDDIDYKNSFTFGKLQYNVLIYNNYIHFRPTKWQYITRLFDVKLILKEDMNTYVNNTFKKCLAKLYFNMLNDHDKEAYETLKNDIYGKT